MNDQSEIPMRAWLNKDDERWQARDQALHPLAITDRPCHAHEYDPQWLDLARKVGRESQELYHWEMVVKELRSSWQVQNRNATPTDRDLIHYAPKHQATFREATGAIGRVIGKALREMRKHETEIARLRDLMEGIELRPIDGPTNREMADCLAASRDRKQAAIDADGCCGGEPMQDGVCFGYGPCPRVQEIKQAVGFCERYLQWLDASPESALADVSARLSSDVPTPGDPE